MGTLEERNEVKYVLLAVLFAAGSGALTSACGGSMQREPYRTAIVAGTPVVVSGEPPGYLADQVWVVLADESVPAFKDRVKRMGYTTSPLGGRNGTTVLIVHGPVGTVQHARKKLSRIDGVKSADVAGIWEGQP